MPLPDVGTPQPRIRRARGQHGTTATTFVVAQADQPEQTMYAPIDIDGGAEVLAAFYPLSKAERMIDLAYGSPPFLELAASVFSDR